MHSVFDGHATLESHSTVPLLTFALGTIVHAPPAHRSVRVRSSPVVVCLPTAMHLPLIQEPPTSAPVGVGLGTIAQLVPSQRAMSGGCSPALRPARPTAIQSSA